MLKIGIIGHLNLKEGCIPYYEKKVLELLRYLKQTDENILIYSALADGSDRLVVEVGVALNIEYVAVLPMGKNLYMRDFNDVSKVKFTELIENASSVIEMPLVNHNTGSSIDHTLNERNLQYKAAGMYISDSCDILIVLWDGKDTNLLGGTSEMVKYHLAKEKYRLYHLPVSRNNELTNDMVEFKIYQK